MQRKTTNTAGRNAANKANAAAKKATPAKKATGTKAAAGRGTAAKPAAKKKGAAAARKTPTTRNYDQNRMGGGVATPQRKGRGRRAALKAGEVVVSGASGDAIMRGGKMLVMGTTRGGKSYSRFA